MSRISKEIGVKYITAWKEAARVLHEIRVRELPLIDTTQGLLSLLPAFEACVKGRESSATSGLIEQQRIFSRSRSK